MFIIESSWQQTINQVSSILGGKHCDYESLAVSDSPGRSGHRSHFLFVFQFQAALAFDSVNVFTKAVTRLAHKNPAIFRHTFKKVPAKLNGSVGLQCKTNPIDPWSYGTAITQAIIEVQHVKHVQQRLLRNQFPFSMTFIISLRFRAALPCSP